MAAPRKDNIRQHILCGALRLMEVSSFEGISLAQIADEVGISKGTLYYHFHSKDALLLALADYYLQQQRDELQRWTEEHAATDPFTHQLVAYVVRQDVLNAPIRMQLYAEATQGNTAIREKLCAFYNSYHDLVAQKLAERTNAISSDFLSWLILLSADGMYVQDAIRNERVNSEAYLNHAVSILQRLMK